jgi:hypothetical protein
MTLTGLERMCEQSDEARGDEMNHLLWEQGLQTGNHSNKRVLSSTSEFGPVIDMNWPRQIIRASGKNQFGCLTFDIVRHRLGWDKASQSQDSLTQLVHI